MENKTTWVSDPTHSEILFKVKHLMITNVKGEFKKFNVSVNAEGSNFSNAEIKVAIDANSVFTNQDDRDNHLKSVDFFDAENHKELTFESTSLVKKDENFQLKGLLTIKGISKEITMDVEFGGINKDPWGNEKAGFSLTGKISRKDWELNWNAALETGGMLVSDEVRLSAEIQLVKKA